MGDTCGDVRVHVNYYNAICVQLDSKSIPLLGAFECMDICQSGQAAMRFSGCKFE